MVKLRAARNRVKARKGKCEGRKAYGHHPVEQKVLDLIIECRSRGLNNTKIATLLNAQELSTRYGCEWSPRQVSRIVGRTL